MTSTPLSIDESLSGSWIDINSISQIPSPTLEDSPEYMRQPFYMSKSVQNLGILPFQVERFLQETQRIDSSNILSQDIQRSQLNIDHEGDDNSGIYMSSDSESEPADELDRRLRLSSSKKLKRELGKEGNNNHDDSQLYNDKVQNSNIKLTKSFDRSLDQLSDSLSFLSKASFQKDATKLGRNVTDTTSLQDFDWLWDWTAQPEYFSGQEWKIRSPKQEHLMRQRQIYCESFKRNRSDSESFSGDFMSLLFLTNILSILIGAGLTYSILMRRPTV